MEDQSNTLNRIVLLMEKNVDSVQIGLCTIAIGGLAAALRRVRAFARFTRPSDIPKRFIRTRTKLNGIVERIEPTGALLMVQHKPLFRLLRTKVDCLPVKISGISVNGNGISWLQSIVSGNNITFIPVLKQNDYIQCEVTMQQKTNNLKDKVLDLAPALVSIGFGKVDSIEKSLSKDPFHLTYYKKLKEAELLAERKRLGNWYYVNTTKELSQKFVRFILTSTIALFKSRAKSTKIVDKSKLNVNKIAST